MSADYSRIALDGLPGLDELDKKIVMLLREDGRMPVQEIAERSGATPATVRARMTKMEEAGMLRVVAVTDFAAAGFELLLAIGIVVDSRPARDIANELAQLEDVFSVTLTTGEYDIEILVAAKNFSDLSTFLQDKVAAIPGIAKLSPGLAMDVLKYQSEWTPEL
ncbi:Lrp/AsnC family transcriptional regulator [Luteithermobacter gelatinilyticus]|uniref:Lrp/AsnC family transcriptional regulator n=1 Tax=Luteithermobacter gelatinilyticus TaxID=2582913 RepID=UPI0011071414|nr:Lrp/AsnC family transcriptional regulator [Luteithermobacter gelatinilyticus]